LRFLHWFSPERDDTPRKKDPPYDLLDLLLYLLKVFDPFFLTHYTSYQYFILQNSLACFLDRDARRHPSNEAEAAQTREPHARAVLITPMHAEGFRLLSTDTLTRGRAVVLLYGKKHGVVRGPHAV